MKKLWHRIKAACRVLIGRDGTDSGPDPAETGEKPNRKKRGVRAGLSGLARTDWAALATVACLILLALLIPLGMAGGEEAEEVIGELVEEEEEPGFAANDARFLSQGEVVLTGIGDRSVAQLEADIEISPRARFTFYRAPGSGQQREMRMFIVDRQNVEYKITLHDYEAGTSETVSVNRNPFTVRLTSASNSMALDGKVELTFSHAVSEAQAARYISMSGVAYETEISGKKVTLIPIEPLEYDMEYTVWISEGLTSTSGKRFPDDVSLRVRTVQRSFQVSLTNPEAQLLPIGEPLTMTFETANRYTYYAPVTLHLYRFDSLQQYADQAHILTDYDVDIDFLERIETRIELLPSELHELRFDLPGEGAYLIEATVRHPDPSEFDEAVISYRKAVCSTDLSLYLQTSRDQTLAWLNHAETGLPLEGYRVEFATETKADAAVSTTTDARGVGSFFYAMEYNDDYGYELRPEVVRIYDTQDDLVYIDNTRVINQYYSGSAGDLYYSFFYADRAIYQPTDEINVWGYVSSYRLNETPTPTELEIVLDPGGLDIRTTVAVDAYGSFNGVLNIEQVKSSQYVVQVQIPSEGDEEAEEVYYDYYTYGSGVLDRLWIDVKEYVKPTFTISSSTDKLFYQWDDTVTVSVTPSFYDGTPLPHYDLEFSVYSGYYGSQGATMIITTDETGTATATFPAFQMNPDNATWGPVQNRYQVHIASDGENITHNGAYYYFPSDTMLTASIDSAGTAGPVLTVNVNEMDLRSVTDEESFHNIGANTGYYYGGFYDAARHAALRGAPKDARVSVQVEYSCRNIFGTYVSSQSYTAKLQTTNGVATLSGLIDTEWLDEYYAWVEVSVSVEDGQGHTVNYSTTWTNPNARYSYSRSRGGNEEERDYPLGYSLAVVGADGESLLDPYYEWSSYNSLTVGVNEPMTFSLLYDGEPVPNEGRLLYSVIQNEIVDQGVSAEDAFTLTQRVEWANSMNLTVAYFDGRRVHPVRDTYIDFDRASVKVDLAVSSDKSVYRPGETVTLTLRATDSSGNGVQGNALLSVVDEAVFALKEQYISLLGDLYGDMYFYNTYVRKYTTTTGDVDFREAGDGGKGDGDSLAFYDSYRKDFKDTAAFLPVRTNAAGLATVSFTLPDNTTSWRITALAVGDNLYGGQMTDNIISTLPFFVSPVVSTKYIGGDEIAMLVQAHGTLLEADMEIDYEVRLFGDEFDESHTLTNVAFQSNQISFGQLPVGEYTLVSTARYSGYSDTVELPIAVIPSNLELVVHRDLDLSVPFELTAMRYPVVISFYDAENEPFFRSISSLLTHYCMRADQRMSRFVAKTALMSYMDPDNIPQYILDSGDSVSEYQNWDGGIAWYEGGESDALLTTKMLLIAPEQFNTNSLAEYLRETIRYNPRNSRLRGSSYMGLAFLGEPVLDEVLALLDDPSILPVERFYLIGALAFLGETDLALELYEAEVTPRLVDGRTGRYVALSPMTRYLPNAYQFRQSEEQLTAVAWIVASYLDLDDADDFALYFASAGWRINSLFECMIYVNWYHKEIPPRTFTYSIDGRSYAVNLGSSGQRSIRFNKSEIEGLSLDNVPEGLTAMAYYIGEPSEVDLTPSENFTIEKSMREIQPGRYEIEITVRFEDGAPLGSYDISEWIPSNMRLYAVTKFDDADGNYFADWSNENQKLYFHLNRYSKKCTEITLRYTAQQTFDSIAVIDSTYIIHADTGENNLTEREMFGE